MNAFKTALDQRPQIGMWQALASPYTAEICAGAGFDFLVFDAEHAPNTVPLVLQQLQAVAPYPVEPIVRLADSSSTAIKHYLDIGARTLLVPMIESIELARDVVAATRYPPHGKRGVGAGLARVSHWNRVGNYLQTANDEICLFLQIESRAGLSNLADIVKIDGVDGIFIGPADLAADMGHLGNPAQPEVVETVLQAIRTVIDAGCRAGVLALEPIFARACLDAGATLVAVATDVSILARGSEAVAASYQLARAC